MQTSSARPIGLVLVLLASATGHGGEIPGLPLPTPPEVPRTAQVTLGNDLLAGFGDILDDFRTQQLVFDGRVGERWSVAVDHSVMTFEAPGFQDDWGRLDQLSASFGYDFLRPADGINGWTLTAGAGLRSVNDFGGAEIQNGIHRLVDDRIVRLPYVDTQRTDATAWLRAQASSPLPWENLRTLFGPDWQLGYWLHGTALATTDGQWDGVAAAHITAKRGWFNAWLGLRGDWRRGYDRDPVQAAVADNEETAYLVIGLRFGPLIIETQQSSESDKGYGRISLLADIAPASRRLNTGREFSLLFGVTAPEVYAYLQGRTEFCGWLACTESRRWRLLGDLRFGNPGIGNATDRYVRTLQLGAGLEAEQSFSWLPQWLTGYAWAGGGWRREQLRGDASLSGNASEEIDRFAALGEVGFRATTLALSERWALRLQVGVSGWLPFGSKDVAFAGGTETLQEPGVTLAFSGLVEFRP